MLPPRRLRLPVLPAHIGGKLLFPLCARCAEEQCQRDCKHSDQFRIIHGTWATEELLLALEFGYQITNVTEVRKFSKRNVQVLHWDNWREYDQESGEHGLLSKYQNMAVKCKVVSSL